jgi:hypothetical protein
VKRRLVTLAAAASLLLCVATVALWVRSYWCEDDVRWYRVWWSETPQGGRWTTYRFVTLISGRGGLGAKCAVEEFDYHPHNLTPGGGIRRDVSVFPAYPIIDPADPWAGMPVLLHMGGFQLCYERNEDPPANRHRSIRLTIPIWFVFCITVLPVTWTAARWRRSRRRERGQCGVCGYDLRATPDRCPECGAVPAEPAAR